ncbi:DUF4350 domain-containing protein [Glaciihabitans sp. UYNi722]|uniref:DUF4350 domain-containing protein n=1 Tax=Glaciihabitans sp. UYNi722 TaxID=3156344 RepID=UPI003393DECC
MTANTTLTPTIRRATRRSLFWILAAAFAIIVALITTAIGARASSGGTPFSGTNPAPGGSKAIVEVLKQQGVRVTVAESLSSATRSLEHDKATLFLYDTDGNLDSKQLKELAVRARHVVILSPTFSQLKALAPEVGSAGTVTKKSLSSGCSLPAARQAATVSGGGNGYRLIDQDANSTLCFGSGKKVFSLITVDHGDSSVTVLGTKDAFSNEHVAERGNAALALTLLGENPRLVWYLPTIADSAASDDPSLAELTPPWVGPVMTLLAIVAIVAAFWRGRRMGPLVVENLPVVVRASETMEGRARLYQRGAARLRALDALRIGAIDRLAAQSGLPRIASVDEVIARVTDLTSSDSAVIRSLLLDTVPTSDSELVRLSDQLLELERAVERATRPS